ADDVMTFRGSTVTSGVTTRIGADAVAVWRTNPTRKDDMEAWDAIRARRNVREYTSEPVSDDDLNRIAEAGWRAPSAKNRQAWDFVIVTDKGQLQELSTVWRGAGHIAGAAAAIALVIPEPPDERRRVTDQYDVGQATMAAGPATRRWESRINPAPFWVCPTFTRWPICLVSGIPLTGHSSRSANR